MIIILHLEVFIISLNPVASERGRLEALKYLHENGCPWNEKCCENASENEHFECLIYLHENGCPWDEKCCEYASKNGAEDCMMYLFNNQCPWSDDEWHYWLQVRKLL